MSKVLQSLLLPGIVFGMLLWYLKHPLSLYYQSLQYLTVLNTMKMLITQKYNTKSDYSDYKFSFMQVTSICPTLSMLCSPFRDRQGSFVPGLCP